MKFDSNVSEAEVLASQQPLEALPVEFAEEFRNWERFPVIDLSTPVSGHVPIFSQAEQRLLAAVVADPGQAVGHYARRLTMNGKAARAARERLVQMGLLREHKMQLKAKGKPAIVLEPLPGAAEVCRSQTLPTR